MSMFKRIFLFMAVNLLVIVTLSIVLNLLGVQPYLTRQGINYESLMYFCLVWGMGGAFISLGLSRIIAKWSMGVKLIDQNVGDPRLRDLVSTVHHLAKAANLPKMPEVGVYESPEINAFATGPTKSRALVAVSSGLLHSMDRNEVEGVLAHEVAHIANGDMVTLTLIQGIINAFVMFIARAAAFAITQAMRSNDDENPSYFLQMAITFVLEILLSFLGMIVVAYFSRIREFSADKGGAQLAGRDKMVAALRRLQSGVQMVDDRNQALAAFKISGKKHGGLVALFSTHPPLEDRIRRLQQFT